MNKIKGYCKTNLDGYTMKVFEFYKVPEIGERVACYRFGYEAVLKVCQITHDIKDGDPYIIVELHK